MGRNKRVLIALQGYFRDWKLMLTLYFCHCLPGTLAIWSWNSMSYMFLSRAKPEVFVAHLWDQAFLLFHTVYQEQPAAKQFYIAMLSEESLGLEFIPVGLNLSLALGLCWEAATFPSPESQFLRILCCGFRKVKSEPSHLSTLISTGEAWTPARFQETLPCSCMSIRAYPWVHTSSACFMCCLNPKAPKAFGQYQSK